MAKSGRERPGWSGKGFLPSPIEYSETDGLFFGKVMGIRALLSYEGTTARELVENFHCTVDDYLSLCQAQDQESEKAYKGSFNVRISPELHKKSGDLHCDTANILKKQLCGAGVGKVCSGTGMRFGWTVNTYDRRIVR